MDICGARLHVAPWAKRSVPGPQRHFDRSKVPVGSHRRSRSQQHGSHSSGRGGTLLFQIFGSPHFETDSCKYFGGPTRQTPMCLLGGGCQSQKMKDANSLEALTLALRRFREDQGCLQQQPNSGAVSHGLISLPLLSSFLEHNARRAELYSQVLVLSSFCLAFSRAVHIFPRLKLLQYQGMIDLFCLFCFLSLCLESPI